MNKKMRELQQQIAQKAAEAKGYTEGENKDIAKAQALLDEITELEKELNVLVELEKRNKGGVPTDPVPGADKKADGFKMLAKMLPFFLHGWCRQYSPKWEKLAPL